MQQGRAQATIMEQPSFTCVRVELVFDAAWIRSYRGHEPCRIILRTVIARTNDRISIADHGDGGAEDPNTNLLSLIPQQLTIV